MNRDFEVFKKTQEQINALTSCQQNAIIRISESHELDIIDIKDKIITSLKKEVKETKEEISNIKKSIGEFMIKEKENKLIITEQRKEINVLNANVEKLENITDIISLVEPSLFKELQKSGRSRIVCLLGGDKFDDRCKLLFRNYSSTMWSYITKKYNVSSMKMFKSSNFSDIIKDISSWNPTEEYKDKTLKNLVKKRNLKNSGKELTLNENNQVIIYNRLQEKYNNELIKHI